MLAGNLQLCPAVLGEPQLIFRLQKSTPLKEREALERNGYGTSSLLSFFSSPGLQIPQVSQMAFDTEWLYLDLAISQLAFWGFLIF